MDELRSYLQSQLSLRFSRQAMTPEVARERVAKLHAAFAQNAAILGTTGNGPTRRYGRWRSLRCCTFFAKALRQVFPERVEANITNIIEAEYRTLFRDSTIYDAVAVAINALPPVPRNKRAREGDDDDDDDEEEEEKLNVSVGTLIAITTAVAKLAESAGMGGDDGGGLVRMAEIIPAVVRIHENMRADRVPGGRAVLELCHAVPRRADTIRVTSTMKGADPRIEWTE